MADTPDPTQADETQVSADGAVELTETQLDTAAGGLGLLTTTLVPDGGFKMTNTTYKIDLVAGTLSTNIFKY